LRDRVAVPGASVRAAERIAAFVRPRTPTLAGPHVLASRQDRVHDGRRD
jgi:hypothetical protein